MSHHAEGAWLQTPAACIASDAQTAVQRPRDSLCHADSLPGKQYFAQPTGLRSRMKRIMLGSLLRTSVGGTRKSGNLSRTSS